MISYMYLFCLIVIFVGIINALPCYRFRRQINAPINDGFSSGGRLAQQNHPSGSVVGTYYYGIGSDPNYGSFISKPNVAGGGGIVPISYNPDSSLFSSQINPNHQYQQQQQQPNYLYNNYNSNNNAWQRPNSNNYNNQFANRYPPGSQGWYATGGNYWYNNGQSIIVHPYLLIITIAFLVFCK